MKIAAQETEEAVFNHFVTIQDTTPSAVFQEISSNMLSSKRQSNVEKDCSVAQ